MTKACVLYTGSSQHGYGIVWRDGKNQRAHRVVWEDAHGAIPEGMVVHHTCGETLCINVRHLELMTPTEHAQLHHPKSDTCQRGHDMSIAYIKKNGERQCRVCQRERHRAWKRRQAA